MERAGRLVHAGMAYAAGYTGRGITAAVIDTGIGAHPDIPGERLLYFRDFVNRKGAPYDDSGHGTHVCGILGGIVNLSFGASCEENDEDYKKLLSLVEQVWDAGICVVGAAGNLGPKKNSVTLPGCSSRIITVGASEPGMIANRFSGRGPGRDGSMKPDLVAPAGSIRSIRPLNYEMRNGKVFFSGGRQRENKVLPDGQAWEQLLLQERMRRRLMMSGYAIKSGTSMATPMVSGAVCLLLQREPDLTPDQIKERLWQSAVDLGFPKEQQGRGMLDLGRVLM